MLNSRLFGVNKVEVVYKLCFDSALFKFDDNVLVDCNNLLLFNLIRQQQHVMIMQINIRMSNVIKLRMI